MKSIWLGDLRARFYGCTVQYNTIQFVFVFQVRSTAYGILCGSVGGSLPFMIAKQIANPSVLW